MTTKIRYLQVRSWISEGIGVVSGLLDGEGDKVLLMDHFVGGRKGFVVAGFKQDSMIQ